GTVASCFDVGAFCGGSFAQIGNGGAGASPTTGTVQDLGNINVQVGHAVGTVVASVGNITLRGGDNNSEITLRVSNYAQIGNGGAGGLDGATLTGNSTIASTINVGATGNIVMQAGTVGGTSGGTFDAGYVQIGDGGALFAMNAGGTGGV